ncbi:sigma 54-interacting transcriptional regulator [Thermodesulfobacteriota bacterium]
MADQERPVFFHDDEDDYTGTINLTTVVAAAETATGSFDIDGRPRHPVGKLFDALPMPALLLDESCKLVFANLASSIMGVKHERNRGSDFGALFPSSKDAARARYLVKRVFSNRKQQVGEAVIGVEARKIWGRMHFRSLRLESRRLMLVLVENLSAEKKQQMLDGKHQRELKKAHDELEKRVAERTAELVQRNEQLNLEITTRRHVEESLRSSERRFKAVFQTAQDSIFIKDANRVYTHVNPAMLKVMQLPWEKIIGKTDEQIFGPDATKHVRNLEDRVLKGQIIEAEHPMVSAGGPITVNCVRVPMRDSSGKVISICGIARDVTERVGMQIEATAQDNEYPSPAMQKTLTQVHLAADTDSIVIFLGESGSGKDYLARYLHDHSNRAGSPFLSINCAALAPELVESELFGHEPGAFTGSRGRKRGLLELAEGGTLVLNEVGELSLPLQAKLLTFLDTQSFMRVGGEKTIQVNARLVAATNRDLEAEVESGDFRKDLFYRLNVFAIEVPPLRERIEDLSILAGILLKSLSERMGLQMIPVLDPGAIEAMSAYDWPGNIRELRNVLERSLILCDKRTIKTKDIGLPRKRAAEGSRTDKPVFSVSLGSGVTMDEALRESKRLLLKEALRKSGGSIKEAAILLGISRASFNHHMKYLGIKR